MTLDPATLAFVTSLVCTTQLIALIVLRRLSPGMPGLGWWIVSAAVHAFNYLEIAARPWLPNSPWTILLATLDSTAAVMAFHAGAVAFQHRLWRPTLAIAATVALTAVTLWFLFVDDVLGPRVVCGAAVRALWHFLAARELLRETNPALLLSARFTGAASVVMGMTNIIRAVGMLSVDRPAGLFDTRTPATFAFLMAIAWSIAWTFGAILMVIQRHLLAATESHAARLRAEEALREAERQQLVRDLHDGLGGTTGSLVHLAGLVRDTGSPEATEALGRIEHLAAEGQRELRQLMNVLDSGDLRWADWLYDLERGARGRAGGLELEWRVSGQVPEEPITAPHGALSLARGVREAIANVRRHASATRARVVIRFLPWGIGIRVSDDGHGLDAEGGPSKADGGRGLASMRFRCAALGGQLSIRRRQGTVVCFAVPLPLAFVETPSSVPLERHSKAHR